MCAVLSPIPFSMVSLQYLYILHHTYVEVYKIYHGSEDLKLIPNQQRVSWQHCQSKFPQPTGHELPPQLCFQSPLRRYCQDFVVQIIWFGSITFRSCGMSVQACEMIFKKQINFQKNAIFQRNVIKMSHGKLQCLLVSEGQ